MTIDLNLLAVLDTVLTERSVARAARRLHVTPSAISNSLARLRDTLGDPLLARSGRGIVPTPRAMALAPALAHALRELDAIVHGTSFDPATTTRTFTLAVADAGQVVRVPRLAARMAADMPRARLRVVGIDSLLSLGGLAGTEIDAVVGPNERGAGIRVEPLFEDRVVLIARRSAPARMSRGALASARHVAVDMAPTRSLRDLAGQMFARAGIARDIAVTVPTFTAAAAIVAETDLVACVPASLVSGLPLPVRVVSTPLPAQAIAMMLAWHDRTHRDPACVAFRELVRASS